MTATLDELRQQGAHTLAPVEFCYIEALAQRLPSQPAAVQALLQNKLTQALAAYQARWESAQLQHIPQPSPPVPPVSHPAAASPLAQLLRDMAPRDPSTNNTPTSGHHHAPGELQAVQRYRSTWSKLSAQRQVHLALGHAPQNAGPINSHMLVLRSLECMRRISPDYLSRFMSYADTLLCLEQSDLARKPTASKPAAKTKAAAKPRVRSERA